MVSLRYVILGQALGAALAPVAAHAQQVGEPLLDSTIPPSYDRGRNISVMERERPELDPLGIHVGGFTALPSVQFGLGETNNALLTQTERKDDGYVTVRPRLTVRSNWSVHELRLDSGANLIRYFSNKVRNEDGWYLSGQGRYDATPDFSVTLSGRTSRQYESRFSSVAIIDARTPAPFQQSNVRLLGKYEFAKSRVMVAANYTRLNFMNVRLFSGTLIDQDFRDRTITEGVVHAEHALTPDTSLYAEATYSNINYASDLRPGIPNRDSHEWKAMGGVSFDLAAPFRGSLAVGYIHRDFTENRYQNVWGLSVAGKIEYFPTQLTTVTLNLKREIRDANILTSSAFLANVGSLRLDHELLRSLILSAEAEYQVDDYFALPGTVKIFRSQAGGKYMLGRSIGLTADVRYSKRSSTVPGINSNISERRATIGIIFQR
ncbi:outer membrane beta-barrel protein [Novosphingobium cyanobacteriorum]|uniref:Outer membrane beta-barrel protein n=1 Tax=Novosphingobium cyanobacteriorum TaxID=3024215 RepID=A0ABT6CM28_9SPHN|nr:outer membrane beta-barrel protein [Novosphingobium cyanobacteriorum]MDF8334975.1 outer membrane beta-barrel protein [Novosphingobium cyanobacteriorum]